MANATSTQLQELYVAYFGRAADPTGLDYWTEKGISQASFAADMYAQNEFESAYGDKSVEAQVNQIYKNLFDREADVTGLTYWTQEINLGNLKVAEIATHLIWAAQNNDGSSDDKTALSNRTAAAVAYTAEVKETTAGILAYQAQSTDPWISGSNITEAVSYLSGIDGTTAHTAAGITASVSTITTNGDPTGIGSEFVLTTSTDSAGTTSAANGTITSSFRFTDTGNEVVTADIGTIASGDVLLDGSSTDSDVMNITANATLAEFTANRIEKFVVNMAAGTPALDVSNLTNFTDIEVTGGVAGSVIDIDAQSKTPTVKLSDYTRVATVDVDTLAGTTTAGTAETVNIEISGATYGTGASTRSGVTLTTAITGTLETLNITSSGTAANVYTLDADTTGANFVLGTVNFLGATDLTTRVDATDVTGVTLAAGSATGSQTLKLDRTGDGTTASNANLFTGFDDIIIIDSASPATTGESGSLTGLSSGQKVTFADDLNTTTLAFKGVSGSSDTATVVLDNETADTDLDVAGVDIQSVESVAIQSNGRVTTSTTAQNLINVFSGDATTVTITGDTSLDINLDIDNHATTARTTTVDASGMTDTFVDISAKTSVSASGALGVVNYDITGSSGNDTINVSANLNGNTVSGGAGNDTITTGVGNSVVDTGEGANTVYLTASATGGTDTITLGSGIDTLDIGEIDEAASAQVDAITFQGTVIAGESFALTYNGTTANYEITQSDLLGTSAAIDLANVIGSMANWAPLKFPGVTAAITSSTVLTLTAVTSVDSTPTISIATGSVSATVTLATTAGNDAVVMNTNLVGFNTTGTTADDIIRVDVSDVNASQAVALKNSGTTHVAGGDDAELIDYTRGTALATTDISNTGNIIKVAYSNSVNAFSDILTVNVELDDDLLTSEVISAVYYDADDGKMVFGFMRSDADDATLDSNTLFSEVITSDMSITEYNDLAAANFAFTT